MLMKYAYLSHYRSDSLFSLLVMGKVALARRPVQHKQRSLQVNSQQMDGTASHHMHAWPQSVSSTADAIPMSVVVPVMLANVNAIDPLASSRSPR